MNTTLTKTKTKKRMEHHGMGVFGFFSSILIVIFVTVPHKVISFIMEAPMATKFVNPDVRQFIVEMSPLIGAGTAIVALFTYFYRIRLYRRQIKEIDDKKKGV